MRALAILALAALALGAAAPVASAIPNVKHPNVTFAESGCADAQWCLKLDSAQPTFTYGETIEWVALNAPQNHAAHRLHLQSFGATSDLVQPGDTAYLAVKLNQAGTFALYSDYRNDRALGMEASFVVVDPTPPKKLPDAAPVALAALALAAVALARVAGTRRGRL